MCSSDLHRRPMPWREQVSAYRTVVSELMCQQTQVATAIPYFDRWTARWPDFAALAREESRGGHHRTDFPREAASAVHSVQLRALGDGVARVPVGVPEVRAAVLGSSA